MVRIPPLPAQTWQGFYLRARACESKGNQNIMSPSKEERILTTGTILPCPKVRKPRMSQEKVRGSKCPGPPSRTDFCLRSRRSKDEEEPRTEGEV